MMDAFPRLINVGTLEDSTHGSTNAKWFSMPLPYAASIWARPSGRREDM